MFYLLPLFFVGGPFKQSGTPAAASFINMKEEEVEENNFCLLEEQIEQ